MENKINYKHMDILFKKISDYCKNKKIELHVVCSKDTEKITENHKLYKLYLLFLVYCGEGNILKLKKLSKLKIKEEDLEIYIKKGILNSIKNNKWHVCWFLINKYHVKDLNDFINLTVKEKEYLENMLNKKSLYEDFNKKLFNNQEGRSKIKI